VNELWAWTWTGEITRDPDGRWLIGTEPLAGIFERFGGALVNITIERIPDHLQLTALPSDDPID